MSDYERGVVDGLRKALDVLTRRRAHYDRYTDPAGAMVTKPAVFAILDELSTFVAAELERAKEEVVVRDVSDDTLTAANVQRVTQGVLDACNEVMTEFLSKTRAAKWDVINQGLYEAERLNATLRERLRAVGVEPTPSRSPRSRS